MNILYVCVHNAGRSQMAEAFTRAMAAERKIDLVTGSAGTISGKQLNPVAVEAMAELGISMDAQAPKLISQEMANSATRIITMGCGVDAEACPARFLVTEDWGLDDPAGLGIEAVRVVRDQIRARVSSMLDEIQAAQS